MFLTSIFWSSPNKVANIDTVVFTKLETSKSLSSSWSTRLNRKYAKNR